MAQRRYWGAWWILFAAIAHFAHAQPAGAPAEFVKLSERLVAPAVKPWTIMPAQTRNLVEMVLPESAKQDAPELARAVITTEARSDHAAALRRLQEIAAERGGQISYTTVCGWPAMVRRVTIELPRTGDQEDQEDQHDQSSRPFQSSRKAMVVTVAVAADSTVVRYEATLAPTAPAKTANQAVALAQKLQCTQTAGPGQTTREVKMLKAAPLKLPGSPVLPPAAQPAAPLVPERLGASRVQTPGLLLSRNGELQIAVSNDAQNVVIGAQSGATMFSANGGVSFKAAPAVPWGFSVDGDPSVGVGWTGSFYLSTIGFPASGCADSVARSVNGGATFKFAGHAVLCPATGKGGCLPDQEQMAVDRFNEAGGSDQLYMVWRNFPSPGGGTTCSAILSGNPTPTLSCSDDSGTTWQHQTLVGTGDRGRPTVGKDGFVYVTFVSGSNLMINKFSQCSQGLVQQAGFPVTIASMNGVSCPVPGLDRCDNASEASPQPAVDDANPQHVFVAYADNTASNNENVVLRESLDGGLTWPVVTTMNNGTKARRFLPWVCVTQGIAYVSWYDRRAATPTAADLTAYFLNTATQSGITLSTGTETNVSKVNDPQCASGWPCQADNPNDSSSCPATAPLLPGSCKNILGSGSNKACFVNGPACPFGESCTQTKGGCPKYGDYNGNACIKGGAYVAWASATPPPGVVGAPTGINIFTDRINSAFCGQSNQPCCFQGAMCSSSTLACDTYNQPNTCVTCGAYAGPCCTQGAQCQSGLVCDAQSQCVCGGPGQPCCGANATCNPGLACNINRQCSCGGENEPCCGNQTSGFTCTNAADACDLRDFYCRSTCGHEGQACCNGTGCNGGLTCSGGVCECGGLNQSCCSGGTCKSNLVCSNEHCAAATSSCATCTTNHQQCVQRCGTDAYCQCLCQNSYCGCLQAGSCGPCSFQSCHR